MSDPVSYLVCATPRSGSTLLCELLKDTGVAGRPEEYFEARWDTGRPPHPGDYLADLPRTGAGIRDDLTPPYAPEHSSLIGLASYRDHIRRSFRLGTTHNGVFGAKLMWRHLPDLQELVAQLPEFGRLPSAQLLESLFVSPRYVWVTRRDKVRQAISLWRALQTRAWRAEHGGRAARPEDLHYRFVGIDHLVSGLQADDDGWRAFFSDNRLEVLEIGYEDELDRDRTGTVLRVLEWIGVAAPPGWQAADVISRQADALSEQWVAAYHRDAAARAGQAEGMAAARR